MEKEQKKISSLEKAILIFIFHTLLPLAVSNLNKMIVLKSIKSKSITLSYN